MFNSLTLRLLFELYKNVESLLGLWKYDKSVKNNPDAICARRKAVRVPRMDKFRES